MERVLKLQCKNVSCKNKALYEVDVLKGRGQRLVKAMLKFHNENLNDLCDSEEKHIIKNSVCPECGKRFTKV